MRKARGLGCGCVGQRLLDFPIRMMRFEIERGLAGKPNVRGGGVGQQFPEFPIRLRSGETGQAGKPDVPGKPDVRGGGRRNAGFPFLGGLWVSVNREPGTGANSGAGLLTT